MIDTITQYCLQHIVPIIFCLLLLAVWVLIYFIHKGPLKSGDNTKASRTRKMTMLAAWSKSVIAAIFIIIANEALDIKWSLLFTDDSTQSNNIKAVIIVLAVSILLICLLLDIKKSSRFFESLNKDAFNFWIQNIIVFVAGAFLIFVVCVLQINSSNFLAFSIFTFVLGIVFKDILVGIMAFYHMHGMGQLKIGDPIEIPNKGIEGNICDVSLVSVKILNSDNTISSIPTAILQSEHLKNKRDVMGGKTEGRRMTKSFRIDMRSIHQLSQQEKSAISKALEDIGSEMVWEDTPSNLNVHYFRDYLTHWLKSNKYISTEPKLMVRILEQTSEGLPIQIYAFIIKPSTMDFEKIQSEILEHAIFTLQLFGLRPYQRSSDDMLTQHSQPQIHTQTQESESTALSKQLKPHPEYLYSFDHNKALARYILHNLALSLDGPGISKDSNKRVHLITLGDDPLLLNIARQAILNCHFPNFNDVTGENRTKITILSSESNDKQSLELLYDKLNEVLGNLMPYCHHTLRLSDGSVKIENTNAQRFIDIEIEVIGMLQPVNFGFIEGLTTANDIVTIVNYSDEDSIIDDNGRYYHLQIDREKIKNISKEKIEIDTRQAQLVNFVYYAGLDLKGIRPAEIDRASAYAPYIEYYVRHSTALDIEMAWTKCTEEVLKLSNVLCADNFSYKLRSVGVSPTSTTKVMSKAISQDLADLARTEHNRWNVERLILGYRPFNSEELWEDDSLHGKEQKAYRKSKKKLKVHADICSYADLCRRDPDSAKYDVFIMLAMPHIISLTK